KVSKDMPKPVEILLVEDSPSDAKLMLTMLKISKIHNHIELVRDGVQALNFLRQIDPYQHMARPDLILLDLNLPKKSGFEVLQEIKQDDYLRVIPVVIMTTSAEESDVMRSYENYANCFITKPVDF